jgi:hypothetical protein
MWEDVEEREDGRKGGCRREGGRLKGRKGG